MPSVCHKCGHSSNWDTVPPQPSVVPAPDIAGHRAALVEIQAEIVRFKTFSTCYISALEEQQNGIEAKLRAIVFPVLSLPVEITSRIFIECLPDNDVSPSTAHAPLLLTRVCRRWKDIAIATCQLWNSLRVDLVSSHGTIMVSRGTIFQTWLSRGRQQPLSLTILTYRREVQASFTCVAPLMSA
ncbi:hypothetical protein C8R45DRAFT_848856 [Mycena sanguinolenta]|nr:hypothetical protein C8R45DRAFT_1224658 [Mycena sanguinolenta]KAJ6450685.1 hypothetical protein C8R45DRAFT_848856 [Mycena sanguinolenta]